jgi:DNA-binding CsgD family transcriptional regulator
VQPGRAFALDFVGREEELALLRAQLDEACAGAGSTALLAGEPGIGKTRTAEELAADTRLRGARVLWGRCYEGEGAPAYWPWLQVLRDLANQLEPEHLRQDAGPGGAELAVLLPELRTSLPELRASLSEPAAPDAPDPASARFRLFESVTAFLARAADRWPLLIVLDDLHWADTASLLLLTFAMRQLGHSRTLILGTYRDVEVRPGHPLTGVLAELARSQAGRRITLQGLTEHDVARLIALAAGVEPSPRVAATVTRDTEGNPFFLSEVVRLLARDGVVERAETPDGWTFAIPDTVRDVIGLRVQRLSPDCRRALDVAAVAGREFGVPVLQHVTGFTPDRLLAVLEEAELAGIVSPAPRAPGRYSFSHALIRETVYTAHPAARRARLHRQVGEALESTAGADPERRLAELAGHFFEAAAAGGADRAVEYGVQAAERATHVLAHERAVAYWEMAIAALDLVDGATPSRRGELLVALGEAQRRAGEVRAAQETFRRAAGLARELGAGDLLARSALGYGGPRELVGPRDQALVDLLEEALHATAGAHPALRVRLQSRLVVELHRGLRDEEGAALSDEVVARARELGDRAGLAVALDARRMAIWSPDRLEERLGLATEIVALAGETGDGELALRGRGARIVDLLELGRVADADVEIAAHGELARSLRQPYYRWQDAIYRAMRALLDGRLGDVERLAEEAYATAERFDGYPAAEQRLVQLFWVRREQGRLPELEEAVRAQAEQHPGTGWPTALAFLYADLGKDAEARAVFEELAVDDFAAEPQRYWVNGLALLAETCAVLGARARAVRLYELLLPHAGRLVVSMTGAVCRGSASRYLALLADTLGRPEDAERHFRDALAANERIGARLWLAYTLRDYAAFLLRRGDGERAVELIGQAERTARELGLTRTGKQLAALRPRAAGRAPAGLSAREIEVLRLLAAGRTSREIAADLVLSVHTVENHLASIYAKIGARGRVEATTFALRHGLTAGE